MVRGVIFDKDGTLFDFRATWGAWAGRAFMELAGGDPELADRLATATGFDMTTRSFDPDSPIIAGTPDDIAQCLLPHLPAADLSTLVARMNAVSAETPQVPATDLNALFEDLSKRDLRLGLITNDAEAPAQTHLRDAGIVGHFHFIAGFDSGHGAKPSPEPLLAFAQGQGLPPDSVVMVGDSLHDLAAARAAGMRCVGVLTGLAGRAELESLADCVLPDIGHLPAWIDAQDGLPA
ncbi:phosphoglycolate phosphatase [Albidovulum inexpectatum]|uniref:phosphoglycolate phosphatase n=1 Tax=Albidovulum inexpectatum TaxID=196587 RepID=A0A2S5JFS8_9RHOB|nr:HAD family hydrolase [Albidovulum inexpectatum]PPB80218.1 phosphoglycolate phosphatase [Albidovulum inexpectatum]